VVIVANVDEVLAIDAAQRARGEAVPTPRNASGIEVAHERWVVVKREMALVVLAAGGFAADRVEPIGPCRSGDRAVPGVADAELPGEVVVDR
jgi:hypothetical protein